MEYIEKYEFGIVFMFIVLKLDIKSNNFDNNCICLFYRIDFDSSF